MQFGKPVVKEFQLSFYGLLFLFIKMYGSQVGVISFAKKKNVQIHSNWLITEETADGKST